MQEDKRITDTLTSENLRNSFVADVLKRASYPQNLEPDKHITLREGAEQKEISFDKLVDFVNEVPQEKDGIVRYIFVSGWERELIIQADEILPIDSNEELRTKLKKQGSEYPILPHGDIDYLWMTPDYPLTREMWEKYHTDGGKTGLVAKLLYFNDPARRTPGTNQPDSGALEKYCCRVVVGGKEFIVPKPELVFLEYCYFKQRGKESDRFGERFTGQEDRNKVEWAKLLLEIDSKYSLDLDLLEESRLKLVNQIDNSYYSEFRYLSG
jgi:hypothetical protein